MGRLDMDHTIHVWLFNWALRRKQSRCDCVFWGKDGMHERTVLGSRFFYSISSAERNFAYTCTKYLQTQCDVLSIVFGGCSGFRVFFDFFYPVTLVSSFHNSIFELLQFSNAKEKCILRSLNKMHRIISCALNAHLRSE